MTAPNLYNITTVTGKTLAFDVTTADVALVTNTANSGTSVRINSLFVANIGNSTATFTVSFVRANVSTKIAKVVAVDTGNTVIVIAKDTGIYLEEGDALYIIGSANSTMQAVISYDVVS
jgi:hypothetical protein